MNQTCKHNIEKESAMLRWKLKLYESMNSPEMEKAKKRLWMNTAYFNSKKYKLMY